jgi:hypothetical protein
LPQPDNKKLKKKKKRKLIDNDEDASPDNIVPSDSVPSEDVSDLPLNEAFTKNSDDLEPILKKSKKKRRDLSVIDDS